ncbi:hypothetical protein AVEN_19432-1 [Araneus ventricosus]|uniref:Uncharacterized protein n=1 Tax=Araneus ventricosus TaxID=182803 RepID=A0A4Y2C7C1_ARAVE|nr:hypothetical protein AVEN_19432-1 [Araneus ventricosus]
MLAATVTTRVRKVPRAPGCNGIIQDKARRHQYESGIISVFLELSLLLNHFFLHSLTRKLQERVMATPALLSRESRLTRDPDRQRAPDTISERPPATKFRSHSMMWRRARSLAEGRKDLTFNYYRAFLRILDQYGTEI